MNDLVNWILKDHGNLEHVFFEPVGILDANHDIVCISKLILTCN